MDVRAGSRIDDTLRHWKPIISAACKVFLAFAGGTGKLIQRYVTQPNLNLFIRHPVALKRILFDVCAELVALYIALVVLGGLALGFIAMFCILRLLQAVSQSSVTGLSRRPLAIPRQLLTSKSVDRSALYIRFISMILRNLFDRPIIISLSNKLQTSYTDQ